MGGKVLLKFLKFLKILFFIRNQQNVISAVDGCVLKVSVLQVFLNLTFVFIKHSAQRAVVIIIERYHQRMIWIYFGHRDQLQQHCAQQRKRNLWQCKNYMILFWLFLSEVSWTARSILFEFAVYFGGIKLLSYDVVDVVDSTDSICRIKLCGKQQ